MSSDFSVSTLANQKLGYGIRKQYKIATYPSISCVLKNFCSILHGNI